MMLAAPDALGTIGVLIVLLAYFLLQAERVRFDDYHYLALNAAGSLLIIFSLAFKFNPASFLIESCWVGISGYGAVKRWLRERPGQKT
jgi:hypothetical protein